MSYYDELIKKLRKNATSSKTNEQSVLYNEAANAIETLKAFVDFQGNYTKEIRNKKVKVLIT